MERIKNYLKKLAHDTSKKAKELFYFATKENTTSTSSYNGTYLTKYNCYSSFLDKKCLVFFYEWSNLNGSKKIFKTFKDLYEFLENSKIEMPDYTMRTEMEKTSIIHMTCIKDKPKLVIGNSKSALEANKTKEENKPLVTPTTSYNYQYHFNEYDDD